VTMPSGSRVESCGTLLASIVCLGTTVLGSLATPMDVGDRGARSGYDIAEGGSP
jgi:hypothetical protein